MYANKAFSSINHGTELQATPKRNHLPGYPDSPPAYFPNQPQESRQAAVVGSTSTSPDTLEMERKFESTNVSVHCAEC